MRKPARLLLFLLALATSSALAKGIVLTTGVRFEFTDCSSGGSAAQTVFQGSYLFRVTTEDVFICYAATCASGGEKFPAGTMMQLVIATTTSISCRSAASTGDAIFTRGE